MKYDCKLVDYLISTYQKANGADGANHIDAIIKSHLNECELCQKRYNSLPIRSKQIRIYQMILFFTAVLLMLIYCLPWFGYTGVTELSGLIILRHPASVLGFMMFVLSIWFTFKRKNIRLVVGGSGLLVLLIVEILEFLSIGASSTIGINANYFSYDIVNLNNISWSKSFAYALPGFYIGVISLFITICLFIALSVKIDRVITL